MGPNSETLTLYHGVADALLALETELRRMKLWQSRRPNDASFESTIPFCVDTMTLPEWIQFVLVPRLARLIEAGEPLPRACGIRALAEETIAKERDDTNRLLRILGLLDRLLTRPARTVPAFG